MATVRTEVQVVKSSMKRPVDLLILHLNMTSNNNLSIHIEHTDLSDCLSHLYVFDVTLVNVK